MGKTFLEKDEYSLADHQELIDNEVEESIWLDYKAAGSLGKADGKKKEIAKDVSAFANSDGGIIVYGMDEVDHKPKSFSFVDGEQFSKEWLENIIDGNIQQRIHRLEIFPVRIDNDLKKSIYVVKIPRSSDAPHMCTDKRYYRRYNFKSVSMEEYEVRLLYARKSHAELEVSGIIGGIKDVDYSDRRNLSYEFNIGVNVKNISDTMETHCKVQTQILGAERELYEYSLGREQSASYSTTSQNQGMTAYNDSPIFPDEETTLFVFGITISERNMDKFVSDATFEVTLYDSSSTKVYTYDLGEYVKGLMDKYGYS